METPTRARFKERSNAFYWAPQCNRSITRPTRGRTNYEFSWRSDNPPLELRDSGQINSTMPKSTLPPAKSTLSISTATCSSQHNCLLKYFVISVITFLTISRQPTYCSFINEHTWSPNKRDCTLHEDLSSDIYQLVEPKVVSGSSTGPLYETKRHGCPDSLRLQLTAFGDTFVIDLVKNKRLISDRYFKIIGNQQPPVERRTRRSSVSDHDAQHDQKVPRATKTATSDAQTDDFYKNHMFLNLHNYSSNEDHCHYHGSSINGHVDQITAISIVDFKLLSGFFHPQEDDQVYYLHATYPNGTHASSTIITKHQDLCRTNEDSHSGGARDESQDGGSQSLSGSSKQARRRRDKRASSSSDNRILHGPFRSNASSLFVELLVVHDHSQFVEYKGNTTNIAERTMQIVNIMNAFYRQLNIFVALVGVVLWTEKDEIELTEDGDSTLTNFLKYRYEKLLPKYHHDNAQLITSTSFNGSVVGKALKGPICTHEHSGGVNTDHSHSPAIVAVTLAHELGHNFGMEHDEEEKCKCADEKCIMSSSSSAVHPKHWSSCSVEYLEEARKHGLLECLANVPAKVFGPICGNGFVEEGEDCDLGELIPTYGSSKSRKQSPAAGLCDPADAECRSNGLGVQINNGCCDRRTCRFAGNASCAQGPCCDLATCTVHRGPEVRVCRGRRGECDLEEVCDGLSEHCPPDVYYHDGLECSPAGGATGNDVEAPEEDEHHHLVHLYPADELAEVDELRRLRRERRLSRRRAYCYAGKCASHESQCRLLWGPSGSVSRDMCYEQNVHGNTSGHCGYNRQARLYEACEPADAVCGMLHCVHQQPAGQLAGESRKTGKLLYGFESASVLTVSFFIMSNHAKIYCHGAIIDGGADVPDPGLVPNGAACDQDKVCVNQRCVPVQELLGGGRWCPSDCNGNGICDNLGVCHCNDGSIGSTCYQFFGANFHLSLVLYMLFFFLPLLALIVLAINHYRQQVKIWWFLHRRRLALREVSKQRRHFQHPQQHQQLQQHHQQHASAVGAHKLTISEPIPLSQRNNPNRPFYDPLSADPWADETSAPPDAPRAGLPASG